ncbi:MAG: Coenzyme F420 hydrogenase/dehydrogenase, beta subunit C-terminal domain [Pseudomonadota bacterium]
MTTAKSVRDVVAGGLCIGCGLCEAVTRGRVKMTMAGDGSMRPNSVDSFSSQEEAQILSACPGTTAKARIEPCSQQDGIWGAYSTMRYAWAKDPEIRYQSATGGVLTALGMHLLAFGQVKFILHVSADPDHPMRSRWVISETPKQVSERCGSRYGPVSPLAGLIEALDRNEPFAIIAKPCDLGAVHAFSLSDPRVDEFCTIRLAMVCGGQSKLKKSRELLEGFGLTEDDLNLFRYRGYGNPGLTTIGTKDGKTFTKTYLELWEDEGKWELETRCKFCPDALGEAADVAAADVWPGGGPTGEDDGFNGIIVRSKAGEALIKSCKNAGSLHLGDDINPRQFDDFQPHQVRKKHAVKARLDGLIEAGLPIIATQGLRLEQLAENLSSEDREWQINGVKQRVEGGRIKETPPQ